MKWSIKCATQLYVTPNEIDNIQLGYISLYSLVFCTHVEYTATAYEWILFLFLWNLFQLLWQLLLYLEEWGSNNPPSILQLSMQWGTWKSLFKQRQHKILLNCNSRVDFLAAWKIIWIFNVSFNVTMCHIYHKAWFGKYQGCWSLLGTYWKN